MTSLARPSPRRAGRTALLATVALAFLILPWADRENFRVERSSPPPGPEVDPSPTWARALKPPYRRFQHDWLWLSVVATLGITPLLALDPRTRTRRGLRQPGTLLLVAILLVFAYALAQYMLEPPSTGSRLGSCYSLRNTLEYRIPGAVLGVLLVTTLRPSRMTPEPAERLARLLGWLWLSPFVLQLAYGLIFR